MYEDDSGFDLQMNGGTYYPDTNAFLADNPEISRSNLNVQERIRRLKLGLNPDVPMAPPAPPVHTAPAMQDEATQTSPLRPSRPPGQYTLPAPSAPPSMQDEAVQTSPVRPPAPPAQQTVRHEYIVNEYSPVIYRRLYDYGLNFIPSYYTYEQRRQLEYMLENLIKRNLLNKLSESELRWSIRQALEKDIGPEKHKPTVIIKEKIVKPRKVSKKKSKKVSKKKSKKVSKKKSKKSSKKPSKKKSKRIAKKVK
jgi:hypothetical protein